MLTHLYSEEDEANEQIRRIVLFVKFWMVLGVLAPVD
jgi:hypothetical protein